MMTDLFHFTEEPLISVIGVGEDSKKYIDEIKGWHSPLVSAKMLDQDYRGPGDGIEVAILIVTENVNATILAKNLKQSGLLTLIVATCEIRAMEGSYDSMAMVPENKVMETVKTVSEILTNPPRYICLDLNDLCNVLKNSETFQTFSYASTIDKGGMKDITNNLSEKLKELSAIERLLVIVTLSTKGKELHKMEDLMIIQKVFSKLPDSIKVVWGFDETENLASDELAISGIATEPRKHKE